MDRHIFSFEKLEVWQKARTLVTLVYQLVKKFPSEEKFSLTSQIQRAVVSVASNIAEGTSRSSMKEQCRFTEVAYGSLMELYCQLMLSKDLSYISEEELKSEKTLIEEISNKLNALKNSQLKRIELNK